MVTNGADRYGVIGYPVSHSRSPVIHRLFAIQTQQKMQYELLQVAPEGLEVSIAQFRRTGGRGLNVTLPHKTEVANFVDEMSERARRAGAINTLDFREDRVFGDNTDGVGLMRDLTQNHGINIRDTNILILGAGGATRGIVGPLLQANPSHLTIANRTVPKAAALADFFSSIGDVSSCQFDEVDASREYHIIINATSAGVKGETPPYPDAAVSAQSLCYDLSYGLTPTPFVRWATEQGAGKAIMGWGMLVEQAAESFLLWRGVRPDTAPVLKQVSLSAS